MEEKPEFYTLSEVLNHLQEFLPAERLEIDIGRGFLPVAAALPVLRVYDHIRREPQNSSARLEDSDREGVHYGKRARTVWTEPAMAASLLKDNGTTVLSEAEYPLFIDASGETERYRVEPVEFPEGAPVERAHLVVFAFELHAYVARVGQVLGPLKSDPLPQLERSGNYRVGRRYDMRQAEALRRLRDLGLRMARREKARSKAPDTGAPEHRNPNPAPQSRPAARIAWLEKRLAEKGIPLPLPRHRGGRSGLKAELRAEALANSNLFTPATFDHAWKELPKKNV